MGQELAIVSKSNHAELRTKGAPTPEGQVPAAEHLLRSGAFWTAHLLHVQHQFSLITPPPLFQPFAADSLPPGPRFAAIAPRADWPPHPAKLAPSFAATDILEYISRNSLWRANSAAKAATRSVATVRLPGCQ